MKIKANSEVMEVISNNQELWQQLNRLGEAVNILEFCIHGFDLEAWGYASPDAYAAELLKEVEKYISHPQYHYAADNASFVLNLMGWCDITTYVVNVWFGSDPTAEVSEEFSSLDEAIAFRDSYADYEDANAVIFYGNCSVVGNRLEMAVY